MTENQRKFLEYQETMRHNLATEAEAQRANKARESETIRSNRMDEYIDLASAKTRSFKDIAGGVEDVADTINKNFQGAKTIKDLIGFGDGGGNLDFEQLSWYF